MPRSDAGLAARPNSRLRRWPSRPCRKRIPPPPLRLSSQVTQRMPSRLPTPCARRRPGPHLPRDMKKGMRNRPSNTRCRSAGRLGPSKGRDPHTRTYSTTPRLCGRRTRRQVSTCAQAPGPPHAVHPCPLQAPHPAHLCPLQTPSTPRTPMPTPSPPPRAPDSPPGPPTPCTSHVAPKLLPRYLAGGLHTPSPRRPLGLRTGGSHTTWTEVLLSCRNSQTQNLRGKETGDEVVAGGNSKVEVSKACARKHQPLAGRYTAHAGHTPSPSPAGAPPAGHTPGPHLPA